MKWSHDKTLIVTPCDGFIHVTGADADQGWFLSWHGPDTEDADGAARNAVSLLKHLGLSATLSPTEEPPADG